MCLIRLMFDKNENENENDGCKFDQIGDCHNLLLIINYNTMYVVRNPIHRSYLNL